jgi:hypothetical protein
MPSVRKRVTLSRLACPELAEGKGDTVPYFDKLSMTPIIYPCLILT